MTEITNKALAIAETQIGKEEVPRGSNWGEPVKTYLHSVGIEFPASWCMAFVYWCYEQAAKSLPAPEGARMMYALNPLFRTGGVLKQLEKSFTHQVVNHLPQPGDIFIMDFGGGLGHTGFIEKVDGEWVETIEGNTNIDGSRNGYAVERKRRKIVKMKAFLRF